MRHIKVYSFIILYILSSICLVFDFHYCGGELAIVGLYHVDEEGCCGEDEEEIPGCCHDKLLIVDTDDSEVTGKYLLQKTDLLKAVSIHPTIETAIVDYHFVLEKTVIPINHAPPNVSTSPLFIEHRVLLI